MINKVISTLSGMLLRLFKGNRSPIIIAGLGRCGTTLVHDSFRFNHHYIPHKDIFMFSDGIDFKPNIIYKIHDYPPAFLPDNVKVIFMFGNPMNTVISSHRRINEWGVLHHKHLGSDVFKTNDDILNNDTLKLNTLFDAWDQDQNFDFLAVRYETLYSKETVKAISDYIGFKFRLFPEKKRKTNWEKHDMREVLKKVYGELNKKILSRNNFLLRNKK